MQGLSEGFLESKSFSYVAAAIALLVAVLLILLIIRIAFGRRLRLPRNGRARQPRLGVVDAFDLDRQRQLVIVRRDNVEHLLMIGGPNDLVIESEIVRADGRDIREGRIRDKDLREKELREAPAIPAGVPWSAPADAPVSRSALRKMPFPSAAEPETGMMAISPFEEPLPPPAPTVVSAVPRPPVFPMPARRAPTSPAANPPGPRIPSREPLRSDPGQKLESGGGSAKGGARAPLATPFLRSSTQRQGQGPDIKPARPSSSAADAPPPATLASHSFPGFDDLAPPSKVHVESESDLSAAPVVEVGVSARSTLAEESVALEVSTGGPAPSQVDTLEEEMAKLLGRGPG